MKKIIETTGVITPSGLKATIAYDLSDQKIKLSLRDQDENPVSRITLIGTVSRVGQSRIGQQFRMMEYDPGDFRSTSLDLADGGWIFMISAYDLTTPSNQKLLFHAERAIFLGEK